MSVLIFAIAAIPAAVVAVVATVTKSRAKTLATAALASLIGALTGSPAYLALDLGFVAIASYMAWPPLDPAIALAKLETRAAKKAYKESPKYKSRRRWLMLVFVLLSFLGLWLFVKLLELEVLPVLPTPN